MICLLSLYAYQIISIDIKIALFKKLLLLSILTKNNFWGKLVVKNV